MNVRGLVFAAVAFVVPYGLAEEGVDLWAGEEFSERREVFGDGKWGRIPWSEEVAAGVFVGASQGHVLARWAQTMEMSERVPLAVDRKVHSGFPWILRAADGRLLLHYRVGKSHASDPAVIVQRTSTDDGVNWSDERVVGRDPDGFCIHNPVSALAPDGRVLLFVSSYDWKTPAKLPCYWSHSDDHGENWSEFVKFDTDPSRSTYYMTEVLSTEEGLYGMSAGFAPDARSDAHNLLWFSPDGREWEMRSVHTRPEENLGNEAALFESGRALSVLVRDRRGLSTWRNESRDGGRTWSERMDMGEEVEILQRPFVTRLTSQVLLLSGRDRKRRLEVVYVSRDNGKSFDERHVIDSYSADGGYTAAVRLSDSEALLVYYGDTRTSRGKPDIYQVRLKLHDRPVHLCFEREEEGRTYLYSGAGKGGEDSKYSWMQPPAGWSEAALSETATKRGTIALAPPPVWESSCPVTERPVGEWGIVASGGVTHVVPDKETGALRITDEGDQDETVYINREWELRPGWTAQIDVRVRVISCTRQGGCMVRVADGRNEEVFTLYPDKIRAERAGLEAAIDLGEDFVSLRIDLGEGGFSVSTGGEVILEGDGRFTAPAYQGRRVLQFGGGSSAAMGEALWKSVSYRVEEKR